MSNRRGANGTRLLLEKDDGALVEIKEIDSISESANVLIFMCSVYMKKEDKKLTQDTLSELTGKQCVILGPEFAKVIGA